MHGYTHVLDLNKTPASKIRMSYLNLAEVGLQGRAKFCIRSSEMSFSYHLDESVSDTIVSYKFQTYFQLSSLYALPANGRSVSKP